ncbi:hypothetical protein BO83DRAFT_120696 [Aspergillus eucalypticola CBS 122712]|uniref:Uncharacterized protein n=1 Tax=Aspergillus eucalypticola (strain CBS 122712 / IBT 29274) TaxID=1448314 RepID=A0A317UYE3_ASPEC|nr:uncharacterized protein BO83DRAFT_120696 [Aspergillus eucalypticola CBS 122712]PWY65512.1 hypothetical protein BO83DRAFT_120696 [Aspergillus eucalypticola CBS 122712]
MNDWATGWLYTTTGLSRECHVTRLPSQSGDAETKVLINAATQLPIFRRTKLFALRPIFHIPYNNGPVSSATATIDESPDRHPSHPPALTAPRQTSDGHCFASLDRKRKARATQGMDGHFLPFPFPSHSLLPPRAGLVVLCLPTMCYDIICGDGHANLCEDGPMVELCHSCSAATLPGHLCSGQ